MANMLFDEINRFFFLRYVKELEDINDPILDGLDMSGKETEHFMISLAQGFQFYMDDITDNCINDNILYMANYWHVMSIFIIYMKAQRTGEAVLMEMIENNFCNVFVLLEKHHYVELCLDQMENKYNNVDAKSLHEIRMNICCRYHRRYNNAFHVLDETMENVNMWTKALPIKSNLDSWSYHSANIVVAKRCNNFVKLQYQRSRVDTESSNVNSGFQDNRDQEIEVKRSVAPSYQRERSRLFELIVKGLEGPRNKFVTRVWIDYIEVLSVKLQTNSEREALKEAKQSELDNLLDEIWNDGDDVIVEEEEEEVVRDDNDDNDGEDLDIDSDNHNGQVSIDEEVGMKSDCHKYGLCNVFVVGQEKMVQRDYTLIRKMKHIVESRREVFEQEIYNKVKEKESSTGKDINSSLQQILNGKLNVTKPRGMQFYDGDSV